MSADDIPGTAQFIKLSEAALDPILVFDVKPIDVSYIKDPGARAVVVLAASCGWNVVRKPGQVATLVSRTGRKLRIPTDTSIKFGVFVSWVNTAVSHSLTHVPTMVLVDKLVKQYKLDESHARVFRQAVGQPASEQEPDESDDEQAEMVHEEVTTDVAVDEQPADSQPAEFVPIERTEPTVNHAGDGGQYISEIMDTIIRQLAADGDEQITYRCKVCGLEFETKRGCGAHYQRHVQAGEAEATAGNKRVIINKIPDYVPTEIHTPRVEGLSVELRRLRKIVKDVQLAVGQDALKEYEQRAYAQQRKIEALTKERDDAIARADRLASDLRSLRELIHGISDE